MLVVASPGDKVAEEAIKENIPSMALGVYALIVS
jgi:hypothetical protein